MKQTAVVALTALTIGAMLGWFINGWRLEASFNAAQVAAVDEFQRINQQNLEEWERSERLSLAARQRLQDELRQSQATASDLRDRLATAELTRSSVTIDNLSECPTHEEVKQLVENHNPFTDDFVRLYNGVSTNPDSSDP